jgi:hypothetical protein
MVSGYAQPGLARFKVMDTCIHAQVETKKEEKSLKIA